MNMQAMVKQAQKLQKEMMDTQEKINSTEFEGKSSGVTVKVSGKKELLSIKFDTEKVDLEDVELLEDMVLVAVNDAMKKVDKETESKMGAYTKGIPGLF